MADARSALIVASASYTDPGLRQLRAPGTDAEALATVLRDSSIGGFDVRTLLDEPAHHINLAVEEFFADRHPDDLLLVHFSCHGVKDEEGELYFATRDTRLRHLGATAVAADFVNRRMGRSRSRRIVLLLDCCYSGAFERGMTARAGGGVEIEAQFGGRGRAVITASSAMEYAFEGEELTDAHETRPSVFTGALVTGLSTGDADRDQDGMVALDELYDYVYDAVRAATPNQTPGKWVFGVHGDLYIARRAQPVTTPAPLPTELHDAADSPFASIRTAAVRELARLLHGRHAGLALAARQTLAHLADDDSRSVAAAATEALTSDTLTTEPTEPTEPTPLAPTTTAEPDDPEPDDAEPVTHVIARRAEPETSSQTTKATDDRPATPTVDSARRTTEPGPPGWVERGLLVAGVLAIVGAVLSLLSLFPNYVVGFRLIDEEPNTWSVVIQTVTVGIAGIVLLAPGTRLLIGSGLLLGGTATALNNIMVGIALETTQYYGATGPGLWIDVATGAVLLIATVITVAAVIGSGAVRLHWPEPLSWLVALAGVVGAVAVYFGQQEGEDFVADVDMGAVIWTSVMALVLPMVAAMTRPRRFAIAILVGWLVISLRVLAYNPVAGTMIVFVAAQAALVAAVVLLIRADRETGVSRPL